MTPPDFFVEEDKIISTLFDKGMDILHLRKPNTEPVYSERLLTLLPHDCYKQIVVHDHFYLKEEYDLKGIHLNKRNPEPPKGYKGHVSCTCYNIEELRANKKKFDYIILAPAPSTNPNSDIIDSFTPEILKKAAKEGLIDKRVMAQGGVCCDNIKQLKDYNFGGVVITDDLWSHFNIHLTQDYKELIQQFDKLRKAIN